MSDNMEEPVQITLFDIFKISTAVPVNEYKVSYILLYSSWTDDNLMEAVFHDFGTFLKCLDNTSDTHLVGYNVRFN